MSTPVLAATHEWLDRIAGNPRDAETAARGVEVLAGFGAAAAGALEVLVPTLRGQRVDREGPRPADDHGPPTSPFGEGIPDGESRGEAGEAGDAEEEVPPGRRVAAAWLLGAVGSEAAVEPLVQALLDDTPALRWAATESLRRLAGLAVPVLAGTLSHYNPELRRVSAHALGVIGPAAAPAAPALELLAGDPRPKIRHVAAMALRSILGGESV